jgi:hypothetical protein
MRLHDPVFERSLIRRAIADSYRIAGGWEAYRRARKAGPMRISPWSFSVLILIVSAGMVSIMSSFTIGWTVLRAATAVGSTGVAILFGAAFRHSMRRPLSVFAMGHLPISERNLARIEIERFALAAWMVFLLVGILHASMAVSSGKAIAGIPLVFFLAAVQWAVAVSIGMLLGSHFAPRGMVRLGLVLVSVSFVAPLVPDLNRAATRILEEAPWALVFLPAGLVEYGSGLWLKGGGATALTGILFPLLTVALVPTAFRRLRGHFCPDPPAFGQQYDFFVGAVPMQVFEPRQPPPTSAKDPARVVDEVFRAGVFDWAWSRFLEKLVLRALKPRDRAVAALMCGVDPSWTGLLITGIVAAIFGIVIGALPFPILDGIAVAIVVCATMLAAPLFGGFWTGLRRHGVGGLATPVFAHFPVSFGEVSRVVLLSNLIRWAIWSPFMILSAGLTWGLMGHPPVQGAVLGVEVAYVAIAFEALFLVIKLDPGTSGMSLFGKARHLAGWTTILLLGAGSVVCLFSGFKLPGRVELWLPPVLSCAVYAGYARLFNRGRVDLVRHSWF